jgi:MoaA/NifB/PqqE/SkfB family radical SAM enzyme
MDKATLLRAGLRRLGTMARELAYLRGGVDISAPESIQGNVTRRCNYDCQYCCCSHTAAQAEDMSIAEWQQALLSLKEFVGHYIIQFAGGEPFVKKGFVELLTFCQRHAIDWGVITNGSAFSAATVARVVAAGPSNIDISVDSPDAVVHDSLRGAPGSLDAIGRGIARLREERARTGCRFPVRIKPTVTRANFRSLPRLVEWAGVHGADTIDFHPVYQEPAWTPETKAALWPHEDEIEEVRGVMDALVELKKNGAPIETPAEKLRSYPDQFLKRVVKTSIAGPCRVGLRKFAIAANGDVRMCGRFPPIGNVRTHGAREMWHSTQAQAIRARTVRCPEVGRECANGCLDPRSLLQDVRRAVLMAARRAL